AGNEFEAMVQRSSCNLKVGGVQGVASGLKRGPQLPKHFRSCGVIGEHCDSRKDSGVYVVKVALGGGGAIGAIVESPHSARADELILARNGPDPAHEGRRWL